jgi:hypothetical protein
MGLTFLLIFGLPANIFMNTFIISGETLAGITILEPRSRNLQDL